MQGEKKKKKPVLIWEDGWSVEETFKTQEISVQTERP